MYTQSISNPLITIGITCYSEGDWLLECWDSVLSQTDDRWVAVLVIDATEHRRTREIFDQLEHPKLTKYAMPNNAGPYPTRNKAFQLTNTPYHFYLDGDDQLLPESIALVLETFAQHSDAGFVYGDYECFGVRKGLWQFPKEVSRKDFLDKQPLPGACAYKKQLWIQLGGFTQELACGNADYDFHIGAMESGIKGYHCGNVFYRYRVRPNSNISNSYLNQYHLTHSIIVQRHPIFFQPRYFQKRFLGAGYQKSALANYNTGNFQRASDLARDALIYGKWKDLKIWGIYLKCKLPDRLFSFLKEVWSFIAPIINFDRK